MNKATISDKLLIVAFSVKFYSHFDVFHLFRVQSHYLLLSLCSKCDNSFKEKSSF